MRRKARPNRAAAVATPNPLRRAGADRSATDEALRANNGTFIIGVKVQPRLQQNHRLQLLLDGNLYGQPSNLPRFQVVNADRGEHSFAVVVKDGERIVQQSETITLTIQRVHLGKP